jgi:hypothetical protein
VQGEEGSGTPDQTYCNQEGVIPEVTSRWRRYSTNYEAWAPSLWPWNSEQVWLPCWQLQAKPFLLDQSPVAWAGRVSRASSSSSSQLASPEQKEHPQLREQTHTSSVLVFHSGLEP